MIDYHGKVALVTGGASGIGRALSAALAARGATVIVADRQIAAAQAVAADIGGGASAIACDLADPAAPAALIRDAHDRAGAIDLVCSNAGAGHAKRVLREPLDERSCALFQLNTFAGIRIAQAYVAECEARGLRGRLMLTASENALSVPDAVKTYGMSVYAATKHSLLVMVEWMREEVAAGAKPLDLHLLLPGGVSTPLIAQGGVLPEPDGVAMISPDRCAELALYGLDLGLFYIPTHAHLSQDMRVRSEGVAAGLRALGLA